MYTFFLFISAASLTGFSVASPIGTIDTHEFELVKQNSTTYKPYCPPTAFISRSGKLKRQLSLHHNNHTPHKNNPLYPQHHHLQQQKQMHKKSTTTTPLHNSTNYDLIKQSSEPHSIYHHSNLLNDLHNNSQIANEQSPGGTNTPTTTTTADICYDSSQSTTDTSRHSRSNSARKRQPINITPNPGYQVIKLVIGYIVFKLNGFGIDRIRIGKKNTIRNILNVQCSNIYTKNFIISSAMGC